MSSSSISSLNDVVTEIPNKSSKLLINSLKQTPIKSPSPTSSKKTGNFWKYFGIVILLLLLGVNIFNYLGFTLDKLKEFSMPVLTFLGFKTGDVINETVTKSQQGVKLATDVSGDSIKDAVNLLKNKNDYKNKNENNHKKDLDKNENRNENNHKKELDKNLNIHSKRLSKPKPDSSKSDIQNYGNKKKYCYVGKDRGYRSCIKIDNDDICMSGDVFSSLDLCINPTLRQ